jgi:hypothetical protein
LKQPWVLIPRLRNAESVGEPEVASSLPTLSALVSVQY